MAYLLSRLARVVQVVGGSPTARIVLAGCVGVAFLLATAAIVPNSPHLPTDPPGLPDPETRRGPQPWFPLLTEQEAWRRLPPAESGGGGILPEWSRALAGPMPRTTAALLELDTLHRERGPLPAGLRGRLRWVVANANGCDAAEAAALADLRRAGVAEADLLAFTQGRDAPPTQERAALAFARKLTLAASTVTDAEVARLIEWYGEEKVVALVLLVAHANFQDRLLLALGVPAGQGAALAPLAVRFGSGPPGPRPGSVARASPDRPPPPRTHHEVPPFGNLVDFLQLRAGMERQQGVRARITLPSGEPGEVNWGLVCKKYQPERSAAWSKGSYAYDVEAEQDPVFSQSLFWVVTHTEGCFY